MIATSPPAEPQSATISAIIFPSEGDNSRLYAPRLCTCMLPQPVADGEMAPPIEGSSAHSDINPQDRDSIPDHSTAIGIGQDSLPTLPLQHPLLQSPPKVSFVLSNSL
jgi:hypothetical protein